VKHRLQFVILAGFYSLDLSTFCLARSCRESDTTTYAELQKKEFAAKEEGYIAVEHQAFVGTGYSDESAPVFSRGTHPPLPEEAPRRPNSSTKTLGWRR
jgi:isocitrate lyase